MKNKVLYLILGILIGAIITVSIFIIIDKKNTGARKASLQDLLTGTGPQTMHNGEPPENIDELMQQGETTILEDGTIQTTLPNGGVFMQKQEK